MIKVICFIRPEPPLIYFVNKIHEKYKVSLVIVEIPSIKRKFLEKVKLQRVSGLFHAVRNRIKHCINLRRCIIEYNRCFQDEWKSVDRQVPILRVQDINSETVYQRIKEERPDLILDHGTSLVQNRILETSKLALNLHWGLSPYYRGTDCTEWALLNWDPFNIGVTIHKLTRAIDGGEIFAQKRATIQAGDTVHSINMQLTYLGTELVLQAINRIEMGQQLEFRKQDYSLGFLTRKKQWSRFLRKQIEQIEKNNIIELMLKNPARKQKLAIVEI